MAALPRLETHLSLRHLTLLDAIAREGSLLGASQSVGLTQSAVTKAVQEAEATLGARLFDRTNRGVRPTQAGEVLVAHARLVIVGGDSQRLHEELLTAGGEIREGRFRRMNVGQVRDLLDAGSDQPAPERVQEQLLNLWPALRPSLMQSLEVRSADRTQSLQAQLAERAAKEAADIRSVLEELARSITAELNEPEVVQLSLNLWPQTEREQFQRNQAALRKRLTEIPGEIEAETQRVLARFADPQARLFPVAVTFLAPEGLE